MFHSQPTISYKTIFSYCTLPQPLSVTLPCHGLKLHGWLDHQFEFSFLAWLQWGMLCLSILLLLHFMLHNIIFNVLTCSMLVFRACFMSLCSIRLLLPGKLRRKLRVEFVAMRLDTWKMGSCLWLVMCVDFLFVDRVMNMRGVKGTRAVLNATLAISATKVSSSL